ncbi:MAG: hypothetical protein MI748_05280 [Opitutales bacterium]|nr:hypothetical protein [Opitutales bacterium]
MKVILRIALSATLLGAILLSTGCQTSKGVLSNLDNPFSDPTLNPSNFYVDAEKIDAVRRVVMMPVHAPNVGLTSEHDIDDQFLSKLTATQLFEVVFLPREDLTRRFGKRSFSSAEPISDSVFQYVKETANADAIAFFDITAYQPFQPIKVGVRGKLILIPEQEVIWAVDEIFDAHSKSISKAAMRYEKKHLTRFATSQQNDTILMSPIRFTGYAAERSILSLPENSLSRNF